MTFQQTLLSAALLAAMFATAPVAAQDTTTDTEVVADASVPKDRLVDRYADLVGDEASADALVTTLREGGEFTVTTTETRTVVDENGDPVLDANGNEQTETVTVTETVENPNGPMGWGEVNITLAMAEKLLESKGVEIQEYVIDGGGPKREEMIQRAKGRSTVPQIFIDGRHIGGCNDLYALEHDGKLNDLLGAS